MPSNQGAMVQAMTLQTCMFHTFMSEVHQDSFVIRGSPLSHLLGRSLGLLQHGHHARGRQENMEILGHPLSNLLDQLLALLQHGRLLALLQHGHHAGEQQCDTVRFFLWNARALVVAIRSQNLIGVGLDQDLS